MNYIDGLQFPVDKTGKPRKAPGDPLRRLSPLTAMCSEAGGEDMGGEEAIKAFHCDREGGLKSS